MLGFRQSCNLPIALYNPVDCEIAVLIGWGRIPHSGGWGSCRKELICGELGCLTGRCPVDLGNGEVRIRIEVWVIDDGKKICGDIAPQAYVTCCRIHKRIHVDGSSLLFQIQPVVTARRIERLTGDAETHGVPMYPKNAARPRAGPGL